MFQIKLVVFIISLTLVTAAPINDSDNNRSAESVTEAQFSNKQPVRLLKFISEPYTAESRQYKYEYETSDGQSREEVGQILKNKDGIDYLFVRGSYSYIGPDGELYSIFYTADENGFQASGSHVPGQELQLPVVQIDRNAVISLLG